jgi:hypothetical protein
MGDTFEPAPLRILRSNGIVLHVGENCSRAVRGNAAYETGYTIQCGVKDAGDGHANRVRIYAPNLARLKVIREYRQESLKV